MTAAPLSTDDALRERVLDAATALLEEGGRDAVTTRSVAAAAGVQAPTLYRLFGDKRGLLDAVAARGYAAYLSGKRDPLPGSDPLDALRAGWDEHLAFGLAHPHLYLLMVGEPRPGAPPEAESAGRAYLTRKISALARAGRLRVTEERAAALLHASAVGPVLTLLGVPAGERDPRLPELARESALAAISGGGGDHPSADDLASAAVTLRALLPQAAALTPGERLLLTELLNRLADPPASG